MYLGGNPKHAIDKIDLDIYSYGMHMNKLIGISRIDQNVQFPG